jgi:hypothetical protein
MQRRLVDAVREPSDVERGLGALRARRGAADERGLHALQGKGDRAERDERVETKRRKRREKK